MKAKTEGKRRSLHSSGHRGKGGTPSTVPRSKLGNLWIPTPSRFPWVQQPRRESISSGEGFRGAEEAVVSDDPSGQQNPMASQGPLDERVGVAGSRAILNRKALEPVIPLGITYSWERTAVAYKTESWGGCGRHLSLGTSSKVAIDGPFEAVLGKTHRTEFSRGKGKPDVRSSPPGAPFYSAQVNLKLGLTTQSSWGFRQQIPKLRAVRHPHLQADDNDQILKKQPRGYPFTITEGSQLEKTGKPRFTKGWTSPIAPPQTSQPD